MSQVSFVKNGQFVLVSETDPLPTTGSGGGGGAGSDRELVVTTYFAKNAFTGASVGDTITATQVIDVTSTPTTVSTIWRNQTTAADLAGAPSAANLTLVGSQALTDGQLRASAVPMTGGQTDGAAGSGLGLVIAGQTSGGVVQILETNASGHLNIADGGNSITVDGTVAISGTVPISAASLPLPTGAATETTLSGLNGKFGTGVLAADAVANPTTAPIRGFSMLYNGTTWDRERCISEVTLLASAARTTTQIGADITNFNWGSLIVVLDMTAVGTGSVTVSIEGKDSASGKYYVILTGAAVVTNSTNRYRVGKELAASANLVAQDYLPRIFRINVTANNANSATYSVGYVLM